jgi:hypothetical protein
MSSAREGTVSSVTHFLTLADVCEGFGMSPGEVNGALVDDGFPPPFFATIEGIAIWSRTAIETWCEKHLR